MTDWIETKMPYGKRHMHKNIVAVTIEQYNDGRDEPCALWTRESYKTLKPMTFKNLRTARKYVKENLS